VFQDAVNQGPVNHPNNAALGPSQGTVRRFLMARNAEFPDKHDAQRQIQGFGGCCSDRYTAAGQAQNNGIRVLPELSEHRRQPLTGIGAVFETRAHYSLSGAFRPRSQPTFCRIQRLRKGLR
jgi:hypothetical protein